MEQMIQTNFASLLKFSRKFLHFRYGEVKFALPGTCDSYFKLIMILNVLYRSCMLKNESTGMSLTGGLDHPFESHDVRRQVDRVVRPVGGSGATEQIQQL